jgi:hypothetical protein
MKCLACSRYMAVTSGYQGRGHDAVLDQQTRMRQCKCGEKRLTVELDAVTLGELRRKAYVYDTQGLHREPVKRQKPGRKESWSEEDKAVLREMYPTKGTGVAQILGKSKKACETKARRMGISRVWAHKPSKPVVKSEAKREPEPIGRVASVFHLARM